METSVTTTGVVQSYNPTAREPRSQAEADAIMATWSKAPKTGEIRVSPIASEPAKLTEKQFREAIAHLPPELQAVQLAEAGIAPKAQNPEAAAADPERMALAASYDMPALTDATGGYGPDAQRLDRDIRDVLAGAGFDRGQGSFLISEIHRNADAWHKMEAPARELYKAEQRALLQRIWGSDFEKNSAETLAFIDHLDKQHNGKVWDWLARTGGAANAAALVQIHHRIVAMRGASSAMPSAG
jgi:hypothetical protein